MSSSLSKGQVLVLNDTLSGLRVFLSSNGCIGTWKLFEEERVISLSGGNGIVDYNVNTENVLKRGIFCNLSDRGIVSTIKRAVTLLVNNVKVPIKMLIFSLNEVGNGKISKSKEEGSYEIDISDPYSDVKDMRDVEWELVSSSIGSKGAYMKARVEEDGTLYYYKLSLFSDYYGFVGHESINEVIAGRLGRVLGLPVLYQEPVRVLVNIKGSEYVTYACRSESYKVDDEIRIPVGDYCNQNRLNRESPVNVLRKSGYIWLTDLVFMWDYLIISRDRHSSNIEFLYNTSDRSIRVAPLFDNGLSLLAPYTSDMPSSKGLIQKFKVFEDCPANNFLGSRSLSENLKMVENPVHVKKLVKSDKNVLFADIWNVLPRYHIEKIWEIICLRYSYLRKFGIIVEEVK